MTGLLADPSLPHSGPPTPATSPAVPRVKQSCIHVDGVATNLVLILYADRTQVIVTQLGKMGVTFEVDCVDPGVPALGIGTRVVESRLLGSAAPVHSVYATEIARLVKLAGGAMPAVISLGFPRRPSGGDDDDMDMDAASAEATRMAAIMQGLQDLIRQG
ncbi:hypothetical protein AMAG_10358 [Allomyces macrogynus ATCC 38327]|uniref:Uncharacterized protein n=1 Tax=Allomyces macrogynus (strain ATCC 38327) TaxID=578462 RepID=A0A0L0SUF9_ALLM3|nr:hypothetical protein AMAG_10358 [Allomyces macrogynus ATCC 38327]|eukprot:KNE66101.1 hypothetical protein AMAG_10358 [Allomyces macrogynus ATCC 38327]